MTNINIAQLNMHEQFQGKTPLNAHPFGPKSEKKTTPIHILKLGRVHNGKICQR